MTCAIDNDNNNDNNKNDHKNDEDDNDKDDNKDDDDDQRGGGDELIGHTTINKQWGLNFASFGWISNNIPCPLI
jgi:hypothetical protein